MTGSYKIQLPRITYPNLFSITSITYIAPLPYYQQTTYSHRVWSPLAVSTLEKRQLKGQKPTILSFKSWTISNSPKQPKILFSKNLRDILMIIKKWQLISQHATPRMALLNQTTPRAQLHNPSSPKKSTANLFPSTALWIHFHLLFPGTSLSQLQLGNKTIYVTFLLFLISIILFNFILISNVDVGIKIQIIEDERLFCTKVAGCSPKLIVQSATLHILACLLEPQCLLQIHRKLHGSNGSIQFQFLRSTVKPFSVESVSKKNKNKYLFTLITFG